MIREQIKPALFSFILLTVITGIVYPLSVTVVANVLFKNQAQGSLLMKDGKVVGSSLIGQPFDAPEYLWGRLSSTAPVFNGAASSGSNYGPMNPAFLGAVNARLKALKEADPGSEGLVPVDLVTASGSGLDPHISPAAAYYQVSRIARLRGIPKKAVEEMIRQNTQGRFLGFLGEPTVNVLKVNLALDEVKK